MPYIDPHAHMISRTTDDYEAMAKAGIVAVIEPAFWIGQARTNAGSYADYLSHILGFERFRAGQFGVRHYCCIGLNSKEANNEPLAEAVMELLPGFATKEGVVAIGEIGYDEQTPLEDKYLRLQLDLARELELPVMIHTPHRDKKRGASRSIAVILEHKLSPDRVVFDHVNEETIKEVKDQGFWAAFSIYPHSKMTAERMVALVKQFGPERLIVDSACDWGISDPVSVPKTAKLMSENGIADHDIRLVTYANALAVYGKSGQIQEDDWLNPAPIDQRTFYQGNTVLRGGQTALVEKSQSSR